MNKTTEALKLAEEALEELHYSSGTVKAVTMYKSALAAIREALAEPVKQEPASNKYNHKRIGWELERTAMGDSYYGNALYSAMDLHFLNQREKDCLHRYMHGSETPNDRFVLQDIANKVYFEPEAEQEKQEPVAWRYNSNGDWIYKDRKVWNDAEPLYAAPVQPVKQEPVAWRVHPFDYGVGHEGVYAMTMRLEQVEAWKRKGWIVEPLYAAPVDVKAIREAAREEALEEAAKVCEQIDTAAFGSERPAPNDCAAAIRGLK